VLADHPEALDQPKVRFMVKIEGFEWDDAKARSNLRKHKVAFELAILLFESPDLFEDIDETDEMGEDRWVAFGRIGQRVLQCAYVWRGPRRRIISLRRADRSEIEEFERRVAQARGGL
jgi:uncharacterized DUF497 family protein